MNKIFFNPTRRIMAFVLVFALSLLLVPQTAMAANNGSWTYRSGYQWITGSFNAQDTDLIYEDDQDYDWKVTIKPSKTPPSSAQVVASIRDANGDLISRYNTTVSGMGQWVESELCSYADFPELTNKLPGTFTLTVDLQLNGTSYANLVQTFSRTISSPVQTTITSQSKPDKVFTLADPIDLVLNIYKTDGIPESFLAAVTVTGSNGNTLLASKGIVTPAATRIHFSIKDLVDLPAIATAGSYNVNLTLADTGGTILHRNSTSFRVVGMPVVEDEGSFVSDLSVGYGRVDISPTEPTPLRGYGFSSGRMSTNIQDPLYATCIAITDGSGNTVLLYTLDLINSFTDVMNAARQQISETTGIPFDAVLVSCTHTHSGPDLDNSFEPSIPRYIESLKGWMTQAAVDALADRAPALVYTTSTETENLNFVRRYQLSNGTYAGDNFGNFKSGSIVGHETDADGQLQLVRFQRQDKKSIILANFQLHPSRVGGTTSVSADIIAPFREKMETTLNCHFAYFTGASGNINPTSRIQEENVTSNYTEQGHALADYALAAYSTFQEIPVDSVKIAKTVYKGEVDHTYSQWGPLACEAVDYFMQNGDLGIYKRFLQSSGIKNVYQVNAVALRSKMPAIADIPTYAVSLGDLVFVTVPFEMFDTNGMQIKEGSPFSTTFVLTCAINSLSYLPSDLAFQHGGYAVDVTLFKRGTAEGLVESYLGMLDTLYYGEKE